MDVAVNKPSKDFLRRKFEAWYADQVMEQLHDVETSDIDSVQLQPVDLSMAQIKKLSGQWLVEMHDYTASHSNFIVNGFVQSGITQVLSESTSSDTSEDDSEPGSSICSQSCLSNPMNIYKKNKTRMYRIIHTVSLKANRSFILKRLGKDLERTRE